MIVAMAAMWMVQVTIDQVIHMIAMRNRFVTASRAVDMPCFMAFALMFRSASVRIVLGYLNHVLRNFAGCLRVEQFSMVEVINMCFVGHHVPMVAWFPVFLLRFHLSARIQSAILPAAAAGPRR